MSPRVLTPLAALLAAGAVIVDASRAETPARASATARASASATLISGTPGRIGTLSARGDRRRTETTSVDVEGVRAGSGELVVEPSAAGRSTAAASAAARSVSVFDGLVTAYGVRRRAEARAGRVTYSGSVNGLEVDGRMIGDIAAQERYPIGDGAGTVTVNRGSRGIVVELDREVNGYPAGSTVIVASVRAEAVDGTAARADPSPTPAPSPAAGAREGKPEPASRPKRRLKRRAAPKIPRRLTAQRFAFPVFGADARVADDFGADRQIGDHQGNDVFAAFGAPVLAVTDGELFKVGTLPISGNRLWLRSDAGDEFFYAHLSAFSPAAVDGRRVNAGQVLGFTGNTGDAEPTPPHVHFEIHPGGRKAIDPHAILLAWQAKRDVPPGAWLARYGSDTEQRPGALVEIRDFIAGE